MTYQDREQDLGAQGNPAPLSGDIQSGRTGDKVAGLDPSAAPLGTDDEAAGTPPSVDQVAVSRAEETRGPVREHPNAATPELQPNAKISAPGGVAMGVIVGVGAAAALGALLYAAL